MIFRALAVSFLTTTGAVVMATPFYPSSQQVEQALEEMASHPKSGAFSGYHQVKDLGVHFNIVDRYPGIASRESMEKARADYRATGAVPDAEWVAYWMAKTDDEICAMISPENPRALVPNYTGGYPLKQGNIRSLLPIWGKPNRYYSTLDGTEWGPGVKVKNPATGEEVLISDNGEGWVPPEGFPIRSSFKFVAAYRLYMIRKLIHVPYNGERGFDGPTYREHPSPLYALAYAYAVTGKQEYADRVLLILHRLSLYYRSYTSNDDTGWGWSKFPFRGYIDDHNFECGLILNMALSYDLVWDGLERSENLTAYLQKREGGERLSSTQLAGQIERNLFGYTWEFIKRAMAESAGNMLMRQMHAGVTLAAVFNNPQILDHLLHGPKNLNDFIVGSFYRDGQFWEDSSWYAGAHVRSLLLETDAILKHYAKVGGDDQAREKARLIPSAVDIIAAVQEWPMRWNIYGRSLGIGDSPVSRTPVLTVSSTDDTPRATIETGDEVGYTLLHPAEVDPALPSVLLYHGNAGFGHGHLHQLMLKIFAFGYDFSADLGYPANFSSNKWHDWTKATLSHPTVTVDQRSQEESVASVGIRGGDEWVQVVSAYSTNAYPKAELYHRTVAMIKAEKDRYIILDIFRVKGGKRHDYSLHSMSGPKGEQFRLQGTGTMTPLKGTLAGPEVAYGAPGHQGASFLSHCRQGAAEGPLIAEWQPDPERAITYRVVTPGGFEGSVIQARGEAEGNIGQSDWDAYLLLRREGAQPLDSTFVVAHEVVRGLRAPVRLEQFPPGKDDSAGMVKLQLRLEDGREWQVESLLTGSPVKENTQERFFIKGPEASFLLGGRNAGALGGTVLEFSEENSSLVISSQTPLDQYAGRTIYFHRSDYAKTTSFEIKKVESLGENQWRLTLAQSPFLARGRVSGVDAERKEVLSSRTTEKLFSAKGLFNGKRIVFPESGVSSRIVRTSITPIAQPNPVQTFRLEGEAWITKINPGDLYEIYDLEVGDRWTICEEVTKPKE